MKLLNKPVPKGNHIRCTTETVFSAVLFTSSFVIINGANSGFEKRYKNILFTRMPTLLSKILTDAENKWKNICNRELKKAGLNCFKVRALKYSPEGKEGVFELRGRKVHFKNGSELLYSLKEIFIDEIYKMSFDTKTPYILDCGANIGLSILYLKELFPSATITAFEPADSNFSQKKKNTASLEKVTILKKAVWKENGYSIAGEGSLAARLLVTENRKLFQYHQ